MSFRWDQRMPEEWPAVKPPPVWLYICIFLVVHVAALVIVLADWPKGVPIWSEKLFHEAFAVPLTLSMAICFMLHMVLYDGPAMQAADHNTERWHQIVNWQRQVRSGVAVLDSVVLAPEPDLAVRMLGLEGKPPENPGKVKALDVGAGEEGTPRLHSVLTQLLTPLLPCLATAMRSDSFEIVMQCDQPELSLDVQQVWKQMELAGVPRVRSLGNNMDVGFADHWFKDYMQSPYAYASYTVDRTPKYRLLLAWHLNEAGQDGEGQDIEPAFSEAAVALLLGSPALMREKKDLRQQAWLLRQMTSDADQVDRSLSLLLDAGQVPRERIHHFWHSRLKGIAQHGTMGAVRESGQKLEEHALEQAVGPQAPVARWLLQALAAKMAHFGQGPQLIALPHEQGVALNLAAKEPAPVDVPWKHEYSYRPVFGPALGAIISLWTFAMLVSQNKLWGTFETVVTCGAVFLVIAVFVVRHPRLVASMARSTGEYVAGAIGF
ncbi:hypothetical protein [Paraburkholderia nodosa]|uniref:hypothetical protein n=1 Tax=Paraburkholderia nodosa TaxID=392320 RepID=UPI0004BCB713|nr:hypothetical protein [Paraburkholderia nodosa]